MRAGAPASQGHTRPRTVTGLCGGRGVVRLPFGTVAALARQTLETDEQGEDTNCTNKGRSPELALL